MSLDTRLLTRLAKLDLLAVDDWTIAPLRDTERRDLTEVIKDRAERASTLSASQLPVSGWHAVIGEANQADAICDRLLHDAHRIELKVPRVGGEHRSELRRGGGRRGRRCRRGRGARGALRRLGPHDDLNAVANGFRVAAIAAVGVAVAVVPAAASRLGVVLIVFVVVPVLGPSSYRLLRSLNRLLTDGSKIKRVTAHPPSPAQPAKTTQEHSPGGAKDRSSRPRPWSRRLDGSHRRKTARRREDHAGRQDRPAAGTRA